MFNLGCNLNKLENENLQQHFLFQNILSINDIIASIDQNKNVMMLFLFEFPYMEMDINFLYPAMLNS